MQNKAALGKRYTCFSCGCKFYDLNKPDPSCPQCGADQAEDPSPDPRVAVMSKYKAAAKAAKKKKKDAAKVDPYDGDLDDDGPDDDDIDVDDDDDDDVGADLDDDGDDGDLDD